MSSIDHPTRRAIYLSVLSSDEPSPLLPETGDEPPRPAPPAGDDAAKPKAPPSDAVRIDFDGIGQRILPIGVPPADYGNLIAGPAGTFFYTESITGDRVR